MHRKGLHRESGGARHVQAPRTGAVLALFVSLLAVGAFGRQASAQVDISATLAGTVADQNGGVVPAATVEIISNDTNVKVSTETNKDGIYSIPNLKPAT